MFCHKYAILLRKFAILVSLTPLSAYASCPPSGAEVVAFGAGACGGQVVCNKNVLPHYTAPGIIVYFQYTDDETGGIYMCLGCCTAV
jgi:hypothetical protein